LFVWFFLFVLLFFFGLVFFFRTLPIFRSYLNLTFCVRALSHPPNTEKTLTNWTKFTAEATNIVGNCSTGPLRIDWEAGPVPPGEEKTLVKSNSIPQYQQRGYYEDRARLSTGQETTAIS